ncbi:unnamed protein product [Merluccius merluccius]
MKEKTKASRSTTFWEIPEKRVKVSASAEEKPTVRTKGQKDVWSSIQAQWPKKTLKELFSDSDTEAANSPPPPPDPTRPSVQEEPREEERPDAGPEEEASEEQGENDKLQQEFPSSGSNSVLNTPPTTPESPSTAGLPSEDLGQARPPSPPPTVDPTLPSESTAATLPLEPTPEEAAGGRSETDSSTVEVESLVATASQKRPKETQMLVTTKKHKPNRKSLGVPPKKNRKAANSSDSEDQSLVEGVAKSPAPKSIPSEVKAAVSPKCPGRTPPSSHKYQKHGDHDHVHHRDHHGRTPRVYKWSFQMSDLEKMNSLERISFLQEKLQDIRNHYLSLKSEVASIDRRRKRMKKKERESTVAASSSSSSSSPSSSSLTAAVMLTLADPPVSSSSSQNSGVSVECR